MTSSSPAPMAIPLMPVSEKLARGNHIVWKAQVVAALRGAQLYGFLDGTSIKSAEQIKAKVGSTEEDVPNPAFVVWKAQEQQFLSYLLSSVSRDILVQIAALPTAAAVWKHLETLFASQSHARVINTRMALATTQKGSSSTAEYVLKMKTLVDEMASVRKKLDDEELISYILAGLDYEYNSLVSSIAARVEPVTLGDMYSQLLAFETRLELQNGA
jgi:hypothetical protein